MTLKLTEQGRALVRAETVRRRRAIRAIVARLDRETQAQMVDVFATLASAAELGPDQAWRLGWTA